MKSVLAACFTLVAGVAAAEPCFEIVDARFCAAGGLDYREADTQQDVDWNHFEDDLFTVDVSILSGAFHNGEAGSHSETEIAFLEAERIGSVIHEIDGLRVTETNLARSDGMNYYFVEIVGKEATLLTQITDFTEEFPDAAQHRRFPAFVAEVRGMITVSGAPLSAQPDAGGFRN